MKYRILYYHNGTYHCLDSDIGISLHKTKEAAEQEIKKIKKENDKIEMKIEEIKELGIDQNWTIEIRRIAYQHSPWMFL